MKTILTILLTIILIGCAGNKITIEGNCEPVIKEKEYIVSREGKEKTKVPFIKKNHYLIYNDKNWFKEQYDIWYWFDKYDVKDTLIVEEIIETGYKIKLGKK